MKVALVSQPIDGTIPPPNNSIGIIVYEFARHLAALPQDEVEQVSVLTFGSRLRSGKVRDQGVDYYHLQTLSDNFTARTLGKLRKNNDPLEPYYASPWAYPVFAWKLAQKVKQLGVDVVHFMNYSQFIPLMRMVNPEVKIVLHMECEWLSQLSPRLLDARLAKTDLVLGCADFVTEGVKKVFPQHADRCQTLYNGIDISRFTHQEHNPAETQSTRPPKCTFVGRVSPEKGVHVLIEAMAKVQKVLPDAQLDVIGGFGNVPEEFVLDVTTDPLTKDLRRFYGPGGVSLYVEQLEAAVKTLRLEKNVTFTGPIPNADLQERLRDTDLLVFPSVWEEPFGIPPVEGMAMGMPVIVTKSGGMNETVLHEKTGLVVERNDPEDLATAILRLLKDPALRQSMGDAAHGWAHRTFSYATLSEQLRDYYRQLLAAA